MKVYCLSNVKDREETIQVAQMRAGVNVEVIWIESKGGQK